jgi:hypothetical protein
LETRPASPALRTAGSFGSHDPGGNDGRRSSPRSTGHRRRLCARLQLDSIPFSAYHISIITALALVGFIEGCDLVTIGTAYFLISVVLPKALNDQGSRSVQAWH